jgi:hypothetical protein
MLRKASDAGTYTEQTAKSNLQKDIDRRTTELQRFNQDSQKELQSLRDELLRPIAEKASGLRMQLQRKRDTRSSLMSPTHRTMWFGSTRKTT